MVLNTVGPTWGLGRCHERFGLVHLGLRTACAFLIGSLEGPEKLAHLGRNPRAAASIRRLAGPGA